MGLKGQAMTLGPHHIFLFLPRVLELRTASNSSPNPGHLAQGVQEKWGYHKGLTPVLSNRHDSQ